MGTFKGTARLVALALLAIAVRLLYIGTQPDSSHTASTDAWGYHRLALNLDRGNGFSLRRQAPFEPDSVRTPLYPFYLLLIRRLFGPHPRIAAIVQALLGGLSTLLTYRLTVQLASGMGAAAGPRAGRFAALLYALNPVQVRQANELLTETLLACLLLFCLCVLVRYLSAQETRSPCNLGCRQKPGFLATGLGLLAALAALCKPNVLYLPLLWLPAILPSHLKVPGSQTHSNASQSRQPKQARGSTTTHPAMPQSQLCWRDAALMLAAFAALITPWVIRNRLVFGRFFYSAALYGNVSRISAPATLLTARGQYAIPWSAEWEAAFGEIVAETALRYRWQEPWETLDARARERADRQVYQVAREVLRRHPGAWLASHLQGTLRYLEPQTYCVLYAHWSGQAWPPDVLDDASIHALRALVRGETQQAGQILAEERWNKLTPLQRAIWWTMAGTLLATITLAARGACALRRHPTLLWAILSTIACVLLLPGPIAYERFRVPVLGPILALAALSFASPNGLCYNRRR